jgi:hypothetical protein
VAHLAESARALNYVAALRVSQKRSLKRSKPLIVQIRVPVSSERRKFYEEGIHRSIIRKLRILSTRFQESAEAGKPHERASGLLALIELLQQPQTLGFVACESLALRFGEHPRAAVSDKLRREARCCPRCARAAGFWLRILSALGTNSLQKDRSGLVVGVLTDEFAFEG